MEALRDKLLVDAVCGGMCSCGTCMVRLERVWIDKTGDPADAEKALIEAAGIVTEGLRLSCQLEFSPDLDGIKLEIASDI